uniref:hypothetical protein n=1 Tax=Vibrio anguillarum TaxID=55601 RepID=UPI001BE4761B
RKSGDKTMSKMALNFFENYKFTVKFNFDDKDLTGVLSLNQSGIPHLRIHTDNHFLRKRRFNPTY